jgi:hypothetical protein
MNTSPSSVFSAAPGGADCACGGGGGGGTAERKSAGRGAPGRTVTAVGSITVNGVKFDTQGASLPLTLPPGK